MKVYHNPSIDYISIDFYDGVEAKSYFENGIIVREDDKGRILGIDITDSSNFFLNDDTVSLREACRMLGISESTMRRRIKSGQIPFNKRNRRFYRFKKMDILKLKSQI